MTRRRPWLVAGLGAVIAGLLLGAVGISGGRDLANDIVALDRVPIDGGVVDIDVSSTQTIYIERATAGQGPPVPTVELKVMGPDGSRVEVIERRTRDSYNWEGRKGLPIAVFDADAPGRYTVGAALDAEGFVALAIGPAIDQGAARRFLVGLGVGGTLVVGGSLVAVFGGRRPRAGRASAQAR